MPRVRSCARDEQSLCVRDACCPTSVERAGPAIICSVASAAAGDSKETAAAAAPKLSGGRPKGRRRTGPYSTGSLAASADLRSHARVARAQAIDAGGDVEASERRRKGSAHEIKAARPHTWRRSGSSRRRRQANRQRERGTCSSRCLCLIATPADYLLTFPILRVDGCQPREHWCFAVYAHRPYQQRVGVCAEVFIQPADSAAEIGERKLRCEPRLPLFELGVGHLQACSRA